MTDHFDYDLHGIVGIRLLDPAPADVATVTRQLGTIQSSLSREPDITVRFVDRLPTTRVCYLGLDEAGFTDDSFLMLRSKHKTGIRVRIPFEQIGKRCEIVCESGVPAVPLLIPIVNLTALAHGVIPLHAAAFTYNGTGVVVTGWSKGGKTETLLAFMSRGAEYIGDEWVYISGDGERMYGIPEPIRMWDWHLRDLPKFRALVGWDARARLRALRLIHSLGQLLSSRSLDRVMDVLKRQLYVDIHPQRLFGSGFGKRSGNFDRLFFVASHESPDITVEPIDPHEVARRMGFSLSYERRDFMAYYRMFRFAFPEVENPLIEQADELQREMLVRALTNKRAHVVCHPYPVSIPALFDAISPLVSRADPGCQPQANVTVSQQLFERMSAT